MQSFQIRPIVLFLVSVALVIFGCGSPDPEKIEKAQEKLSPLIGTWQKIAEGQKEVSGVAVKMMISERILIMDAPGCLISGEYTAADGILTFVITSMEGPQCASGQAIGKSDSVHYVVTDSRLTLIPLMAGEDRKLVYQRVDPSRR